MRELTQEQKNLLKACIWEIENKIRDVKAREKLNLLYGLVDRMCVLD